MNAATYYVVIAGLGGTPEYDQQFAKWANDLDRELQSDGRGARVETLAGAKATKEQIRGLFSRLDAEAKADDAVAVFLLGHGAFDGVEYKFNIPGPDLTAAELNALLNRLPPRRQLVRRTGRRTTKLSCFSAIFISAGACAIPRSQCG